MKTAFIATFVVFSAVEIFIIARLMSQNRKVGTRATLTNFSAFFVLVLLRFLLPLDIPYLVLLFVMAAMLIEGGCGYVLEYYYRTTKFDRFAHMAGSFAYAQLLYFIIANITEGGGSRLFRALFVLALGIASGAYYEVVEFKSDEKRNTRMQRGLRDTDFDILFDILGSAAAAVFSFFVFL